MKNMSDYEVRQRNGNGSGPGEHGAGSMEPDEETKKMNKQKGINSYLHTISYLFGLTLVLWGLILPIATFLSITNGRASVYLSVYHMLLDIIGLLFVIYLHFGVARKAPSKKEMEQNAKDYKEAVASGNVVEAPPSPEVAKCGEGISLYQMLGCIVFALGFFILDIFRLIMYVELEENMECYGVAYIIAVVVRLILVPVQTLVICLDHKLLVARDSSLTKYALMHLIVMNLCNWFISVVTESAEAFLAYEEESSEASADAAEHHRRRRSAAPAEESGGNHSDQLMCMDHHTLLGQSSKYLFPFEIEFSLIAATVFYAILVKVGTKIPLRSYLKVAAERTHAICHKTLVGILIGLIVVAIAIMSLVTYFLHLGSSHTAYEMALIFMLAYGVIEICTFIGVIVGACKLTKLKSIVTEEGNFDTVLVVIASLGGFFLHGFSAIGNISALTDHPNSETRNLAATDLVVNIFAYVYLIPQICFIADGFKRRVNDKEDVANKPGRGTIMFLLLCNLSMWLADTFQTEGVLGNDIQIEFYGFLAWTLIFNISKPLLIFFHFHSSCCLAEMWSMCYEEEDEFEEISDLGEKVEEEKGQDNPAYTSSNQITPL